MRVRWVFLSVLMMGECVSTAAAERGTIMAPEVFLQGHDEHSELRYSNPAQLPDGTLVRYGINKAEKRLSSHISEDGGRTWKMWRDECELPETIYTVLPLVDRDGEVHLISMVGRGEGREIAVTRFIDVWHQRTTEGRTRWISPTLIYKGYCGALLDFKQLSTGRLVVPLAWWVPNRPVAPPVGANLCTAFYSDDGGSTWIKSKSDISSPCYPGFVGNNYGADEPSMIELKNGRLWMLMRTQTGFLYESFSNDMGETWSEARPSRFAASSSPPVLWRMPDDRILLLWNNCESPPAHEGIGVYCNRDALHGAISDDEGKTWRGFREVYRDPLENETPPQTDRGTAYPTVPVMVDGKMLFLTGQGAGRRNLVSVDPDWITAPHDEDHFEDGLRHWIAFKPIGPAKRWRRARMPGPRLVDHPTQKDAKVLHILRPDEHDPDGALWNFPNGSQGTLTLAMRIIEGCQGGILSLTDRSFKPTDTNVERLAIFNLSLDPQGERALPVGEWFSLTLSWDLAKSLSKVSVNDKPAARIKQLNPTANGISYLHLRSTADSVDRAGFMIESVSVDIKKPVAPRRTPQECQALLDRYEPSYYEAPPQRSENAKKALKLF